MFTGIKHSIIQVFTSKILDQLSNLQYTFEFDILGLNKFIKLQI